MSDWKIQVNDASHGIQAVYIPILVQRNPAPTEQSAVQIGTRKPEEAVNFSLSAQLESGTVEWDAYSNPTSLEVQDFSYDPATDTHTLQEVIDNGDLDTGESIRLQNRFSQDTINGEEIYTVKTITEQRIWLKEYIHDHGLASNWELYGPSWTDRVSLDDGTPVFINEADIEPVTRPFEGTGRIRFQVGDRL